MNYINTVEHTTSPIRHTEQLIRYLQDIRPTEYSQLNRSGGFQNPYPVGMRSIIEEDIWHIGQIFDFEPYIRPVIVLKMSQRSNIRSICYPARTYFYAPLPDFCGHFFSVYFPLIVSESSLIEHKVNIEQGISNWSSHACL